MEPKRHSARVLFRTRRHTYGCPNQRFGRNMQLAVRLLLHRTHTLLMRPHWSVRSSAPVLVSALAASWLYLTKTGVPIGRVHVGGRIREGLSLFPSVFSTGVAYVHDLCYTESVFNYLLGSTTSVAEPFRYCDRSPFRSGGRPWFVDAISISHIAPPPPLKSGSVRIPELLSVIY